jgi:sugar diacid utilization regulator
MIDAVQELVDTLAQALRRSVAVDDAEIRLIAHSMHFGDADASRLQSLVGREADPELLRHLKRAGIRSWRKPGRLPVNQALGADYERLCIPLRDQQELLGYMWVIEKTRLSESEVARCTAVADELAKLLAQRTRSHDTEAKRTESLVFGLTSSPEENAAASADLLELGFFAGCTHFTLYLVALPPGESSPDALLDVRGIRKAFERSALTLQRNMWAHTSSKKSALLVVGGFSEPSRREMTAQAEIMSREIQQLAPEAADGIHIGVSDPARSLTAVPVAFEQAQGGARIAAGIGQNIAFWSDHPLEALLSAVVNQKPNDALIPSVLKELGLQEDPEMAELLGAYLDNGCNVVTTSAQMHVHRSTIYYRLERFRKKTGLDLENGEIRLLLHLWLRVLAMHSS